MTPKSFKDLFEEAEQHLDYWIAGAEIEFTEELARAMKSKDVSRAELARRIGTSQAYITKVLRGNVNFTLASMVKLARAFEMDIKIHFAPRGAHTVWLDELGGDWDYAASVARSPRSSRVQARAATGSERWIPRAKADASSPKVMSANGEPTTTEVSDGIAAPAA